MAWEEELFAFLDDVESQAEAVFAAEREAELADRRRAEYLQVTLASRLAASVGSEVTLGVRGVGRLTGTVRRVAADWLLLRGVGQDWAVRHAALTSVTGASRRSVPEIAWSPLARLGLGSVLRRLADGGERCLFHALDGTRTDGVPERVGADFVEVSVGEPRRLVLVPFGALAAVQSRE